MKTAIHASVVLAHRGRILLVREEKVSSRGRWNLPGGHHEPGETIEACARREAREEVGLEVLLSNVVGIYTGIMRNGDQSVRFVFRATPVGGEEGPGDEIEELEWATIGEIREHDDQELVAPDSLREILDALEAGTAYPLALLRELAPGS